MAEDKNPLIVVVDDEANIRKVLKMILDGAGYESRFFPGHEAANSFLERERADVIISDIQNHNQDYDGITWMGRLRKGLVLRNSHNNDTPVAIITAAEGEKKLAAHAGADAFLEKPFDRDKLLGTLAQLVEKSRARNEHGRG